MTETPSGFELPAIAAPAAQPAARLIVAPPRPDALARGLVVLQDRAEHLRIVDVFGPAGLDVVPHIGHLHVTVDDAQWHWVDPSGKPLIIDTSTVQFEIPPRRAS